MSEPTVTRVPEPDGPTATAGGGSGAHTDELPPALPGYELHGLIGRGGMGAVYRARDLELGREVAVKILLPHYAPDSAGARRFVDEARITGRLQHPSIPAIYRVGALPDGRPFLAMKLIGGQTLEEMLRDKADPAAERSGPAGVERLIHEKLDRLDAVLRRGRFLAIFEQVAQAVGYAHEQGVIHRDLKPANVMVGAFGEVQVMDWGIARSGDRRPVAGSDDAGKQSATLDYSPAADHITPNSDLTQAGAILGTPAYMPPEQAVGAVDQIGKHSDVFGLGGILCVVLTGKPPFVSDSTESTRLIAARGKIDSAFARLDACGAEPELVALAKRCLAPEPSERPKDAGEVASAVAAFRADAERRARQAETERATAEVKAAEERKRRRTQRALALVTLWLFAVTVAAGWWIERERARRRHEQEAKVRREAAEKKEREAELQAQQLARERDVIAALNEVQVLREQGWKQADDPERWALTLVAARPALRRAELLAVEGDPRGAFTSRLIATQMGLEQDERDRALLAELDRVADSNEIRLFFPVTITGVLSRQFESAFKAHGIDLLAVPTVQAVAWLRKHRFRDRLVVAIRTWRYSLPYTETIPGFDTIRVLVAPALAAVGGGQAAAALLHHPTRPTPGTKLDAILKGVTDDQFTRDWWDAVERKDAAKLKELVGRPEIRRMTARELGSLADGLSPFAISDEVLHPLLDIAYERFPGEFWVHIRLAFLVNFSGKVPDPDKFDASESYRHLTAALAIRPNSAVARAVIGMEMIENKKDEAAGLKWLHSAAKVDPTSPWPHLFIGMYAMEKKKWPEAFRAMKEAVRVDPDTAFFMFSATAMFFLTGEDADGINDGAVVKLLEECAALHPNHPGGYQLLGQFHFKTGDHRAALAAHRKARELRAPDDPMRWVAEAELTALEAEAAWEAKLPAVLRGELKPAGAEEVKSLAGYCATFEKKYALAVKIVTDASKSDPKVLGLWLDVAKFAGWAAQAGAGRGDGAALTDAQRAALRRQALDWLQTEVKRQPKAASSLGYYLTTMRDFAPVRDPKELAKLPADERKEWERFWAEVKPVFEKNESGPVAPKSKNREVAPPPRPAGENKPADLPAPTALKFVARLQLPPLR